MYKIRLLATSALILGGIAVTNAQQPPAAGAPAPPSGQAAPAPQAGQPNQAAQGGGGQTSSAATTLLRQRPSAPAALEYLKSQGVKLVSLGEVGGLEGYLGEAPDGRNQVFYLSPDGGTVIAGIAFDARGTNLTGLQIGEMRRRVEADRTRMEEERRRAEEAARAANVRVVETDMRAQGLQTATVQFGGPIIPPQDRRDGNSTGRSAPPPPSLESAPTPTPAASPPAPQASPAAQAQNAAAARFLSPLNNADVTAALEGLPWFRIGRDSDPTVYLLADPQCPFCHAAWRALRSRVIAGDISVRVILVGALPGSQDRVISILARGQEAGRAWLRGEGSQADFPVAPPPAQGSQEYRDAARYAEANADFARRFNLLQTPWLAYRGTDGKLYSKFGSDDMPDFLSAIPLKSARN